MEETRLQEGHDGKGYCRQKSREKGMKNFPKKARCSNEG